MNDATLFEIKKKVKFRLSERYYIAPQLNSSINSANVVRQYVLLHNLRGGYGFYGVCIRCGLFDSSSVEGRLKNGSISVCRECFTPDINDSFKRNVRTFEELEQTRMALGDINYNDWILEPPWIYERDKRWVTFTDMKDFIEDWYDLAITLVQIGYEWKVVSG
ncbi:hypothetical protein K7432_000506 [Basidiobolus ranarum]|uniref:HEPN/RES N-terminal domain-containing protein n=1 Tax=Basidiobolus ranarum TaxID=34480 RepID=A0ABR2X4K9_9FUNG